MFLMLVESYKTNVLDRVDPLKETVNLLTGKKSAQIAISTSIKDHAYRLWLISSGLPQIGRT